mgnify:CR=1 FL=1
MQTIVFPTATIFLSLSVVPKNLMSLKKNEEIIEKLEARIVGRTSLNDVYDPLTQEILVAIGFAILMLIIIGS